MISSERLKQLLQNSEIIKAVEEVKEKKVFDNSYLMVFQGDLVINENDGIAVYIAIPQNWELDLIDIYLKNYDELGFLPHIDRKGKLCLFETEGILIDHNLEGILLQSLLRAQEILKEGVSGENQIDFINEFELYWAELKESRVAHLSVSSNGKSRIIKGAVKNIKRRKKEKFAEYAIRCKKGPIYIGEDIESLKKWKTEKTSIVNVSYFVVNPEKIILPPDIRKEISEDYLNRLLHLVPKKELETLMSQFGKERIIIFEIHQPLGKINIIGMHINGGTLVNGSFNNICKLQPIILERADKNFLMKRIAVRETEIYKQRILVIGCGSIGGYVICELAKAGYEDLTIIDNEVLKEENIFRHVLGMEYVNRYKSEALSKYIQANIPEVRIGTLEERIEEAITEENIELNDYDLIISTTGSHNINRWINSWIMKYQIKVPVIYAWNEVYGIGNHVACIKYGNCGCYECFFARDEETGEIYDRTSYCKRGQLITENAGGCGKTFVPYGNMVSLKTALLCLKLIRDIFEGKVHDNMIISLKGEDEYFIRHNLKTSGRYLGQKDTIKTVHGDKFVNRSCGVCNGYKGK